MKQFIVTRKRIQYQTYVVELPEDMTLGDCQEIDQSILDRFVPASTRTEEEMDLRDPYPYYSPKTGVNKKIIWCEPGEPVLFPYDKSGTLIIKGIKPIPYRR